MRQIFAVDLRDAAVFMKTLPSDSYFYFYAERWTLEYEVVRLLVPGAKGENKLPKWGGDGSVLDVPSSKRAVFVFFGADEARLAEAQKSHPGGTTVFGPRHGDLVNGDPSNGDLVNAPSFVAYLIKENRFQT